MKIFLVILGGIFIFLIVLALLLNYKSVLAFTRASYKEMTQRVTFPTWERVVSQTYIILGSVVFFAFMFGVVDTLLVYGMGWLFG